VSEPRRYTKYSRRRAVLGLCLAMLRGHANRLGVSSDEIPMLDYDATSFECQTWFRGFESDLSKKLGVDVVVIRTERGYHLIPLMVLYPKGRALAQLSSLKSYALQLEKRHITPRILPGEIDAVMSALEHMFDPTTFFDDFYRWLLKEFHLYIDAGCLDGTHIEVTLRRRYTTLRISGKENRPYDIEYMHVMTPDGIPLAIDLYVYLYTHEPHTRCVDFKSVARRIVEEARRRYRWMRPEAAARLYRFLVSVATEHT